MSYNFQKFEGRNVRLENRITITKSNSIGFPSKFYNDNKIKDFKFVILYWDKDNQAVGIKFTNDESEKNKFSIIHSKVGYGGSVIARSFFKACEINPKLYYGRYDWEKQNLENIGDIYIIIMKEKQQKT